MRKLGLALLLCVCLGLTACGAEKGAVPGLGDTAAPLGFQPFVLPGGDVQFPYPVNWALTGRPPPGIATVSSGGASVTVWAYRTASPVSGRPAAQRALARLVASVKARDPKFELVKSDVITVSGVPAAEIEGRTEINGRAVEVRSVHVYKGGEYVVDALADPDVFARVNAEVVDKLLAGSRFGGNPPLPAPTAPTTATPPGLPTP